MSIQKLIEAQRKADEIRQELAGAIVRALTTASVQQLAKVAQILLPEPKVETVKPKAKAVKPKVKVAKPKVKVAKRRPVGATTWTSEAAKNAAEGRRAVATGERPALKEAMVVVMGREVMSAQKVVDALDEKKWLPASTDHRQYISFMLSNNCPGTFVRTAKRGYYEVAGDALRKVLIELAPVVMTKVYKQLRTTLRGNPEEIKLLDRRLHEIEMADQGRMNNWSISPDPLTDDSKADNGKADNGKATKTTNGNAITAAVVWKAIRSQGWPRITLPTLAKHLGCAVNQLGSPLTKLRLEGKVTREEGKDGVVYEMWQGATSVLD